MAQDKFNVAVFLEYFGLDKFSEIIEAKTDIELSKVMNGINHQINERITNSLFFQEFEFIHEKSLGEILRLWKGEKLNRANFTRHYFKICSDINRNWNVACFFN